ncbi:prostaglandin E2 receptor EP4 subtype-like [Ylistrum balloti]|uniref:prostaglandin E2 receptor EP4 subtype-like n=1 Tax=Ylistrum balloti TaxID=509963 RepID=UPI0029059728|nr:prostaglandin E2 receptor EP4 subtype-like [Ylistrum balloti]
MDWSTRMHAVGSQAAHSDVYDSSTLPYFSTTYSSGKHQYTHSDSFASHLNMGNITAKKTFLASFDTVEDNITNSSYDADAFQLKKNNSVMSAGIMFGTGVIGNLLAIFVLLRSGRDQRRTIFYRLVAGLTITDLIGTTLVSPVVITVYLNDFKWKGGQVMCSYFGYSMAFAAYATMTIVCAMSIERVICIKHPFLYQSRLSKKHATIFLLCCWIFAAIIAALPLAGFGEFVLHYPYTWCFFDYYTPLPIHKGFNCLFAGLALLIISTTFMCNMTVMYTLLNSWRKKKILNGNSRKYNGYNKRFAELQMLVLLIGITAVFSTCYTPLMVRILINQTGVKPDLKTDLLMIRFASLNQILDPWVYILLRREVVWKVIQGIKFLFGVRENEPDYELTIQKANLMNDGENQSCCRFCLHCMCDPPMKRPRSESLFSTSEYELRRSTIVRTSPMQYKVEGLRHDSRIPRFGSEKELNQLLTTLKNQNQNQSKR